MTKAQDAMEKKGRASHGKECALGSLQSYKHTGYKMLP